MKDYKVKIYEPGEDPRIVSIEFDQDDIKFFEENDIEDYEYQSLLFDWARMGLILDPPESNQGVIYEIIRE